MLEEDFTEGNDRPSKTKMKEAMHELQDLGAELVDLSVGQLKRVNLPEDLLAAVRECQKITSHGARRRQIMYIGKMLRNVDEEPIRAGLFAATRRPKMPACTAWSGCEPACSKMKRCFLKSPPPGPASICNTSVSCAAMRSRNRKATSRQRTSGRFSRCCRISTKMACRTMTSDTLIIGLVSISDRASTGVYEDKGIPALQEWLSSALTTPWRVETRLIADDQPTIENTLIELVDRSNCHLVLTTGGTGPALRDVTPEATLAIADKEMPGFGKEMRRISLNFVPTAILSRQVAVIRKQCLIINLPGQPKSIKETLEGVRDAEGKVSHVGIFAAVPYCIDLIGGPYAETNNAVIKTFRPKSAIRAQ